MRRWTVAAAVALLGSVAAQGQTQSQRPTFRGGTNLVLVDAYPRRDGHIVEGLTPEDFEVLEDGKVQAIDQFEFVRIEPVPEDERIDPKTQAEMVQLAADPHNRVFVVLLDSYHVSKSASKAAKWPLVNMLNRVLGKGDLIGVTTPKFPPSSLVLGRKLVSVEDQLTVEWGERDTLRSEEVEFFNSCFSVDPGNGQEMRGGDGAAGRRVADILIDRWREDKTLQHLKGLITRMGELREARTLVMAVTSGWRLFREDNALANMIGRLGGSPPQVGVPPGGGPIGILSRGGNALPSNSKCTSEALRLASLDDERVFLEIVSLANRNNIVFYPLSPGGLAAGDAHPSEFVTGGIDGLMADMDHARARADSAFTLANETDGVAIVNRNDFRNGLQRIINDVSAYYLLGYYSPNQTADGKLRRIKVRVKQKNVEVAARRGYVVPTAASVEAKAAAKAAVPAPPVAPVEVTEALKALDRIGVNDGLLVTAASGSAELSVIAELSGRTVEVGKWKAGGAVTVTVNGADGAVASGNARIEPGGRSALVRVPVGAGSGPWRVTAKLTGSDGTVDAAIDVRDQASRVMGSPIVFRGAGSGRAVLKPAAELLFHRTERVHVEFPLTAALDQREARLLDVRGRLVPAAPTLTEREVDGRLSLAVDLNLAPLSGGDYVIEITAGRGSDTERRHIALRVVR